MRELLPLGTIEKA
jgi:hypothetical protein